MIDNLDPTIARRQYNALMLTGIGIAVLFYPVLAWLVLFKGMDPVTRVIISRLLIWGTIPAVYQYAVKVEGRDFILWKEQPRSFWFYLIAMIALLFLAYCAMMIAAIPRWLGFHDNDTLLKYWNALLRKNTWLLVFTCVTAGFTEELLFRAYVLPRLALIFKSAYTPVIVSALIFAAIHLGNWNLSQIIFTFLLGLICGLYYQRYRNLQALIIFHALYDFLVLFKFTN